MPEETRGPHPVVSGPTPGLRSAHAPATPHPPAPVLRLSAALAVGLLLSSGAAAQTDCSVNASRLATVVFPASLQADDLPIADGALLRATDPRGRCVGEVVWSEADGRALVLRGSEPGLPEPDGLLEGEDVTLSVIQDGDAHPLTVSATDLAGGDADGVRFASGGVHVVQGLGVPVGAEGGRPDAPLLTLNAPAPNPARTTTTLRYRLGAAARVVSEVFDMLGRRLVHDEPVERPAGDHAVPLHVAHLPAGVYLARVTVGAAGEATVATRRFTVSR